MSGDPKAFAEKYRHEITYGGFCMVASPYLAEMMGHCGFDWLGIDCQHGMIDMGELVAMMHGVASSGTPVIVRVPWNEPVGIMRALDAGANGVIVPMINTPDEARAAVGACRYAPEGYRSYGPGRTGPALAGFPPAQANKQALCLVMIETVEAVDRIDDILAVEGIDGVFVGPGDLALTQGFPPAIDCQEPAHVERILKVLKACQKRGIVPGIMGAGAMTLKWREAGFKFIGVAADRAMVMATSRQILAGLRK